MVTTYSNDALGQVVRGLRERRGVTQEELGRAAGYGSGAGVSISRLESGLLHPGPERFAGLAHALGLTPDELEAQARARSAPTEAAAPSRRPERAKQRALRIQREVDARTTVITDLTDAFNQQHDRARDAFFLPLYEVSSRIAGAPRPDPALLEDDGTSDTPVGHDTGSREPVVPASRAGRRAKTAAVGSAAVLTGLVATPSLIFAAGGLIYMAKRNRKQQQELAAKLDEAEAELAATGPGVDALRELLPRATSTLDYIATHAGHALARWEHQLDPGPSTWAALSRAEQRRYQDFIDVADAQVRIVTIDVQGLLTSRGQDQQQLIRLAADVLAEADDAVTARV